MGGTACKATPNSNKAITIAILGLDNAGKTTTTRVLEKAPVDSVAPTIGYSQTDITHKNEKIKLIDLGGAKTFREAWRHYYDDAYGFVYVLDSSEEHRLDENREVLKRLLQEEKVKGKPILILANKQDKAEALDKNTILEDLKIERLVNENQTLCRVEVCTAKSVSRSGKQSKIDDAIRHGFDWLIKTVYENYDTLHKRVDHDVQKRNEVAQREKRERQERIQKLREEREKEEGANGDGDDNDEETIKNGFVPIGQAVKNAEKSTSGKPQKEKSGKKPVKTHSVEEEPVVPPKPAPRAFSQNRAPNHEERDEDRERSRRHSGDISPRRRDSAASSNHDDVERIKSPDDQASTQPKPGKKRKVIGAGRPRRPDDHLPPLAPSSSASRREDFPLQRGPPVGTPRPQPLVAQWAITSPTPQYPTEKLTTISSDNEHDDDYDKRNAKNDNFVRNHSKQQKHSSGHDNDDDSAFREASSSSKPQVNPRLNHRVDDDSDDNRKKNASKPRHSRKHSDDDDGNDLDRQRQSSAHKTVASTPTHRFPARKSRTRANDDDDDDDDDADK